MVNPKKKRVRGLILSLQGWQKVQEAKIEWEIAKNQGNKITLEEIGEQSGLTTATIRKILIRDRGVDRSSIATLFSALNLELTQEDCEKPVLQKKLSSIADKIDWGEALDISIFYGRTEEQETLRQWIVEDRCRLISIVGIGGIGKTSLSIKITQQVKSEFKYVAWRSLRDAPPIEELLINLIQFLSDRPIAGKNLPENTTKKISLLLDCLRSSRCLVVLDNIESLMCSESRAGTCHEEYKGYSELFQRLAESEHQSCILLTAREKAQEVAVFEGDLLPVRSLYLSSFKEQEGEKILQQKGLKGTVAELSVLVSYYNGNPLALKMVGTTISDLFEGNIAEFLRQETVIFGDIRDLLNQQFQRLLDIEEKIMYWLAINREPITLKQLQEDLVDSVTRLKLIDGLESLSRRCLIARTELDADGDESNVHFTLQSVVLEYVTNQLIEKVCQEIITQELELFRYHALVKATAKDYIKEAQKRQILRPLIERLFDLLGCQSNIENRLNQIKTTLQTTSPRQTGYVAGNILNLLCYLETDLTGADFSCLCIWQADLQNVRLHDVSFQNADLSKTVFLETFGGVCSVAFSPDGRLLSAGDSNGNIRLWRVETRQQVFVCKGHTNWVLSVAFSPDGELLASSSSDKTVKLWNIKTGISQKTLYEHQDEVWSVAFSADGKILASGSDDNTIRIWSVNNGKCLKVLNGHESWVTSVAFNSDDDVLVSGSDDCSIKLWDIDTGECLQTLTGHSKGIRTIAISSNNQMLASGSEDYSIKLWNIDTGECFQTLTGHSNRVFSIAFSLNEDYIFTSCHNCEIKVWDVATGKCLKTFKEHSNWIFSIAVNRQNGHLASGSHDQTVRLWDTNTGKVLRKFQGYSNQVLSVAHSPDGQRLASGSYDFIVRLWDINTGMVSQELQGHTNGVYSVAFNPAGDILASASGDNTIKIWKIDKTQTLITLKGHRALVRSVAFSPNGKMLASGSEDNTVRLWDFSTGQILNIFQEHQASVWSVAFSPDGRVLASGSWDNSVKLWNINTGECYQTLNEHTNWVLSVAFSPDGQILASCSADRTLKLWNIDTGECQKTWQINSDILISIAFSPDGKTLAGSCQNGTIKLWNLETYECIKTLSGHSAGWIWSIKFRHDSQVLASGSEDETIKLWDIITGNCLKTMKAINPYNSLNIKKVSGLTTAAKLGITKLGAVEII